ncbi:MAG: hemolysin family protein [Chloroflexota bacterium]
MVTTILVIVVTMTVMIGFNALYVAAEFATVAARKTKISQIAADGNRRAQRLMEFMEDSQALDRYVAACQLGITVSSLVLGAYGQNVIAPLVDGAAPWISTGVAITVVLALNTTLQVVMGELLPKSIAVQYPERVALAVLTPMIWSLRILKYPIKFFNGSGLLLLRLMGRKPKDGHGAVHSPEEIELLVSESHESGLLDDSERTMLRNAFRMRDLTARQVMVHRTRLIAAPLNSSVSDIINKSIDAGFSRVPVYRDSLDEVIGFVHVKDLFRLHVQGEEKIDSIIRDVIFVPESLSVADVWDRLENDRKYLTIVFDEYGGTAGMITFEDLIEEIFGELQDEFDDENALIARDKDGRIYLRADLLVSDVNEYLELKLPTEADTLSGLVFSELGRAPRVGDKITVNETMIRIEAMEGLGVAEVSLQLPEGGVDPLEWEVADHD